MNELEFWSRAEESKDGCLVWKGAKRSKGYRQLRVGRGAVYAHRHAWELTHGPIPEGLYVCHHCDTRACVRPDHLFLGSHKDNMHDRNEKGRASGAKGEKNGLAKLTAEDVRQIKGLLGKESQEAIGQRFGVTQSTVSNIALGKTWKHVPVCQ